MHGSSCHLNYAGSIHLSDILGVMQAAKKKMLLDQVDKIITELKALGFWDIPENKLGDSFLGQLRFGMIPGILSIRPYLFSCWNFFSCFMLYPNL